MRICHVGPTLIPVVHDLGGACERRVAELAAAQVQRGDEVTVLSRGEVAATTWHRGFQVVSRRAHIEGVPRNYEFLYYTRQWVRHHRPDIVHFHGIPDGALALAGLHIPSVLTVDWYKFWVSTRPIRSAATKHYLSAALRQFKAILPDSAASASLFSEFWGSSKNVSVLPEGVSLGQFHPDTEAADRERVTRELSGPVVLYVGRLCEQKGTDILLDAWEQRLAGKGTLVLAGPMKRFGREQEDAALRSRIRSLGVRYLGAVPEAELAALYNSCDIFVMPTRMHEMFGMAALEAEACGKPVVASRCQGLVETVAPDAGIFFEPGDSNALGLAIELLLDDASLRARMGDAAVRHAAAFSWPRIAARLATVYRDATEKAA